MCDRHSQYKGRLNQQPSTMKHTAEVGFHGINLTIRIQRRLRGLLNRQKQRAHYTICCLE